MFQFQGQKIYLEHRLCLCCFRPLDQYFREQSTCAPSKALSSFRIVCSLQIGYIPGYFPQSGKRVYYSQCRLCRFGTSQNRSQHIETSFCKGPWLHSRFLKVFHAVEIFHHILFFRWLQYEAVTIRELLGIVPYSFVYLSRLCKIQFGNIPVKYDLLSAKFDNAGFNLLRSYRLWQVLHIFCL